MDLHFKRSSTTLLLVVVIVCVQILSTQGTDIKNERVRTYKYVKGYTPTFSCRTATVTVETPTYITKEVIIPHYITQNGRLQSLTTITKLDQTKYITQTKYQTKYETKVSYTPYFKTTYQTVYTTIRDIEFKTRYETAYKTQTLTKYSTVDHTTEKFVTKTETVSVPHSIEPSTTIVPHLHHQTVENGPHIYLSSHKQQ